MNVNFDKENLKKIMTHFYNLTKIRMVIYDDSFNIITSVPESDCGFCKILKSSKTLNMRCGECDKKARLVCGKTNEIYTYTCHAGLFEAISPIKMDGIILGYVMLGQIIDSSEKKKKKSEILSYVNEYTKMDLSEAYDKLTTKSKKQIEAAANIMEACACYLWAKQLVKVNENCLSALISAHISKNLTSDLSVDSLCAYFGISRNKLYKISKESFGTSIAAYVRKQRVANAALLLKNGLSVAEAAYNSGFYDYNYFSKIFKTETGILPGKYKKTNTD